MYCHITIDRHVVDFVVDFVIKYVYMTDGRWKTFGERRDIQCTYSFQKEEDIF